MWDYGYNKSHGDIYQSIRNMLGDLFTTPRIGDKQCPFQRVDRA